MDPETIAVLEKLNSELGQGLTTFGAKLEEVSGSIAKIPDEIKTIAELTLEAEKSKMEAGGPLGGILDIEVWDIPVGQAVVGGFVSVLVSELIDGFLAKQGDMVIGIVKLAAAGAAIRWGKPLLGSAGSKAVGILLAYDGIRHILPIDQWAHRLATGVSGVVTTRGLGGNKDSVIDATEQAPGNGHQPDYYEALKGGPR